MPTYDYRCAVGHRYEKREPFGSPPEQPCEQCDETARRVIHAPPVVFKGSGWYKTDSRSSTRRSAPAASGDDPEKSDRVLAAEAATNEREARKESVAAKKKAEAAKTTSGGSGGKND